MPPRGFPPMSGNMARSPFQMGGMSRRPMQIMGGMGRPPMQSMGRMSPFGSGMQMGGAGTRAGGGGLISRLFQRSGNGAAGNVANAISGFQRAGSGAGGGSLLKGLANPGNINSFLNNTQNVLRTAQQIGPMFQQYGPLVKNLPAMWRMYKGLKSVGSDDELEDTTDDQANTNDEHNEEKGSMKQKGQKGRKTKVDIEQHSTRTSSSTERNHASTSRKTKGESVPKLYV